MDQTSPTVFRWRIPLMLLALVAVLCGAIYAERQVRKGQSLPVPQLSASAAAGATVKAVPMASFQEVSQEYERGRARWQTESDPDPSAPSAADKPPAKKTAKKKSNPMGRPRAS